MNFLRYEALRAEDSNSGLRSTNRQWSRELIENGVCPYTAGIVRPPVSQERHREPLDRDVHYVSREITRTAGGPSGKGCMLHDGTVGPRRPEPHTLQRDLRLICSAQEVEGHAHKRRRKGGRSLVFRVPSHTCGCLLYAVCLKVNIPPTPYRPYPTEANGYHHIDDLYAITDGVGMNDVEPRGEVR